MDSEWAMKALSQKSPVNGVRTSAPIGSNIHAHVKTPRRTLLHPDTEGAKVRSCFIFPLRNKLFFNKKAEHLLTHSYLCICSFGYFAGFGVFFTIAFLSLLCCVVLYFIYCVCAVNVASYLFCSPCKFISMHCCCDRTILCKSVWLNPNQ